MIHVTPVDLCDERVLRRFPESAILTVLDATLLATEQILRVEHPTVDEIPFHPEYDVVPSLLTAHLIISRVAELRDLLHLYSAAVHRAVRYDPDDRHDF